MPFALAKITAKVLALVEAILDNFVTVQPGLVNSGLMYCSNGTTFGYLQVYNVTANACGVALAQQLTGLVTLGLSIANAVLPGLLAVEN